MKSKADSCDLYFYNNINKQTTKKPLFPLGSWQ